MTGNKSSINKIRKNFSNEKRKKFFSIFFITTVSILILASIVGILAEIEAGYSATAKICISCHNDTIIQTDTDLNGIYAPYERPHNNTIMCETCHNKNPHTMTFIQPDGSYGARPTAANCPACHQVGIPQGNNTNFTTAFMIPNPLRHSSDISNGSVWGNYWTNTSPKTACIFCHDNSLHNTTPLGRIFLMDYKTKSPIGLNFSCTVCHYKGDPNWSVMSSIFTSAGLQIPPEITNGTNWNGRATNYFNHSIENYSDFHCKQCHGSLLSANATMSEFAHNVGIGSGEDCIGCHNKVTTLDLGRHSQFNGTNAADNGDCKTCHYAPFPMVTGAVNASNTHYCADCHTLAGTGPNKSSIIFTDKRHGKAACADCHVADGTYHQDDPRGAVNNSSYVTRYVPGNTTVTDCADCHYASNLDDAPFNAPGGGSHVVPVCANGGCHSTGTSTMVKTVHIIDPVNWGIIPSITVPTLNATTVAQGKDVIVNATVSAFEQRAYVDGAQYRIMSGSTEIRSWTPMSALDGNFNGATEVATATIKINISAGNYTIQVRGMAGGPAQNTSIRYYPINGDVSPINSANLTVLAPLGYINGTVTDGASPLGGVLVSVTGGSSTTYTNGFYSLMVIEGTHNVTASKRPEYYDNSTSGVAVISGNTTVKDFVLTIKPTGNITGTVTNAT